ncbi:hypothetical protein EPA93_07375 [Ktedonosporobacter rubrisoli]|uniref:Asl1-like glycosyl hydrolase catalytic domain-containing protein n=1 Tax=Ktedonosporobacter rubrisoli TaxID=2509675 RepID=A0A4P6JKZ0_KTERU|nr:hypothetical protein [Ktedonosporobacter rubrisoli]QBD75835.1 hypothetical protein EPA93_07375 [Ktedonosporobacter rubrisoli]
MRISPQAGEDEKYKKMSRRQALQLCGASIVGSSLLAACWPLPETPTTPGSAAYTATLGAQRPLAPYFMGYNNVPLHSPAWSNPKVLKVAKQLKAGNIRYPGGTVANYWDWQNGWFLPGAPRGFLNSPHGPYRLEDLLIAYKATNAQPIYVLNMLTSDLDTQVAMLRAAQNLGLPVNMVELGNEFYIGNPQWKDNQAKFPSGQDYGTMAASWIKRIKQEFPQAKIALVGSTPTGLFGDQRRKGWNDGMLQAAQGADAITIHPYVSVDDTMISDDETASVGKVDDAVISRWQDFENLLQSLPANMKVWVTEYNLIDNKQSPFLVFRKWLHGVLVSYMTLSYLSDKRTELVSFYDMLGKTGNETFFLDRSESSDDPLDNYTPTAAGRTLLLLGDTLAGMSSATPIIFDQSAPEVNRLAGWIFANGAQRKAFIANCSANSLNWNVDKIFGQGGEYQQMSGQPFKIITSQDDLTITQGSVKGQLKIPGYSVTQVKLT